MNKNPNERQSVEKNAQDVKGMKKDQQHQAHEDKKKRTIQFDQNQKFTSDEDILRRRTA